MRHIHELHQLQSLELQGKVQVLGASLEQVKYERKCDQALEDKILESANSIKHQNDALKQKVQPLK